MMIYEIKSLSNTPTIVLSDIHASPRWREAVAERRPGERLVFLGDYFMRRGNGPFAESDAQNFREICAYARSMPDTHLLTGNHDFDCLPISGWPIWILEDLEDRKAIMENLDLLEMVFVDTSGEKPLIFSHGGVTQSFLDNNGLKNPEELNRLWRSSPERFAFMERDPNSGASSDIYGDDPWQSPIWARDMAITEDGIAGYNQVVGHTVVSKPEFMPTIHGDKFLMTCTLDDTCIRLVQ